MLCYAEGMTSRVPNSAPTPTPEHLPALLDYRMDLDLSAPGLSGLLLLEVQGCFWLELQLYIWILSPKAWAAQHPSFRLYEGLKSMWLSEGRNHTGTASSSSHPQGPGAKSAPRSLQQLMRNSWEYKSNWTGAASLFMCFVLRAVWGG